MERSSLRTLGEQISICLFHKEFKALETGPWVAPPTGPESLALSQTVPPARTPSPSPRHAWGGSESLAGGRSGTTLGAVRPRQGTRPQRASPGQVRCLGLPPGLQGPTQGPQRMLAASDTALIAHSCRETQPSWLREYAHGVRAPLLLLEGLFCRGPCHVPRLC